MKQGSQLIHRLGVVVWLSLLSVAAGGHSRQPYMDNGKSPDGRHAVTAQLVETPPLGKAKSGDYHWQFTWRDSHTNESHVGRLEGLRSGKSAVFDPVHAHILVPPGGETFAVWNPQVLARTSAQQNKPPRDLTASEVRDYPGFSHRLTVYRKTGEIVKRLDLQDLLAAADWQWLFCYGCQVYWQVEYPGLTTRGTPLAGHALFRLSPDQTVLETRIGATSEAAHKAKERGVTPPTPRVLRIDLVTGKLLPQGMPLDPARQPVQPFKTELALAPAASNDAAGGSVFRELVAPFLARHCQQCHGDKKAEGELKLHTIDGDVAQGRDTATWQAIGQRLLLSEMPPEGHPQPSPHAKGQVLAWLKSELTKAGKDLSDAEQRLALPQHGNRVDHDALFATGAKSLAATPARLWRASPHMYAAWSSRLTKNRAAIAQPFSSSSTEGIKDYASLFIIDEPTISQLLRNAQAIVELQVTAAGGVRELTQVVKSEDAPSAAAVEAALRKEFQLVLQREPSADELDRFSALMEKNVAVGGQAVGSKATLAAIFLLPEALYRLEFGDGKPDEQGRRMLAPRELAAAIGFALSDAGADQALQKAAAEGRLATPDDVHREALRLLSDDKYSQPRLLRFIEEYFEYPAAMDVFKDLDRGEWRPEILVNDTRLLVQRVLADDRDVLKRLLTTNESYINYKVDTKAVASPARIANKKDNKPPDPKKPPKPRKMEYSDLYNLPDDWEWTADQPLALPTEQRAGILTQPSWLAAFATNDENHAIRRGKWIRERLLGSPIPDLPITVDAQLPHAPEKTLRERMEITRQEYCWQCHRKMNPLGLTFESYDYLGRFRAQEPVVDLAATEQNVDKKSGKPLGKVLRHTPIDASGLIEQSGDARLDGPVENAVRMIHRLAESPRVRQVFARHAFRFWLGRNETLDDAATLVAADQAYLNSGGSLKALVASLVTSDSFLYRKP